MKEATLNHTVCFVYTDKGKTYTVIERENKYFIYRDGKLISEVKDINKFISDFYKKSEKQTKKEEKKHNKLINKLGYVKGVYRYLSDDNCDMIIFDGENFYKTGWEIPLKISDTSSSFSITKEEIGELLYEWKPITNERIINR